jgi:hypothetical protein
MPGTRLDYGPAKYAAFHLLLCRWMRLFAPNGPFQYVTLGGTELRDIQSLRYIDVACAAGIISYELEAPEFNLAITTRNRLEEVGCNVDLRHDNFFSFQRDADLPHLFFFDLKGCFVLSDYHQRFADMLLQSYLRPGDTLLITSHLGFRRGWNNLLPYFTDYFDALEVEGEPERRKCFRRVHPSFTLFRALAHIGYQEELALQCFGCIEYRDKSPMAIYGYLVKEGNTPFLDFVTNTPYFHIRRGILAPGA